MKKLLSLALLTPALLWAADEGPRFTGEVKDVRIVRAMEAQPGSSLLWEPYIAQWSGRQLVTAFGAGIPGKTDMGDILASVSTDDGNTWAEPVYVFNHNQWQGSLHFAYANAILYKPEDQAVMWCFAMRCPMNYRNSEDAQLVAAYSADGGRSWTPVELAMGYGGPLIVVAGIERVMENGHPRYLLPAHRNSKQADPKGDREQFILSSTSLLEWSLAGYIPQPASGPVFLHEGGLAPGDQPGELKLVMRTATYDKTRQLNPPRAYSSVSRDGGRTWSQAKEEPDLWNARSKAWFGKTASGAHVYIYSDGPSTARMSLRYKVQGADGAWGAEKTFYDSGTKNSYPTLIAVAPGEYRAVWDSGTPTRARTHICFAKITLP